MLIALDWLSFISYVAESGAVCMMPFAFLCARGPGNPCGFEQHGFETARLIAGLEEDLLERAIDSAAKILESDPSLQKSAHQGLKQSIIPDIQIGY
jgi:hypothetical protein